MTFDEGVTQSNKITFLINGTETVANGLNFIFMPILKYCKDGKSSEMKGKRRRRRRTRRKLMLTL